MSNTIYISLVVFFIIVISWFSYDLGIAGIAAESVLNDPEIFMPEAGLWTFLTAIFGVLTAFFQIMTFQSSMPHIINLFFFVPMSFGMLFIIITIARGGAR